MRLAASRGEPVPANIDTGANLITKANINSARAQELISPKTNDRGKQKRRRGRRRSITTVSDRDKLSAPLKKRCPTRPL